MIGHGGLLPNVLGMSRGFTLRHAQAIEDLGFDMQFNAGTAGRIVLRVTIVEGNSIHPT